MTAAAKTTLGTSPWPARQRRAVKVYESINTADLALCDDKPKSIRPAGGSKYHAVFEAAVQTGQAIKTPPGAASTVANIARTWLRRQGYTSVGIKSTGNYGDGSNTGRVWLMRAESTPAQPSSSTAGKRARKGGAA
jgi:hypothetical protein